MASPEVWTVARGILEAASLGVPFSWPNEGFADPADSIDATFVAVEIEGGFSRSLDVGIGGVWEESGSLWCYVMVPAGTGIVAGDTLRKQIRNLFRDLPPGAVTWGDADEPAGDQTEDGGFFAMPLRVAYRFTDRPA